MPVKERTPPKKLKGMRLLLLLPFACHGIAESEMAFPATFEANSARDMAVSGGAQIIANPLNGIRSGNPGERSRAAFLMSLNIGAKVETVAFQYRYTIGFGAPIPGVGSNFTLRVAGVDVYSSPHLDDHPYSKSHPNYSNPVVVNASSSIGVSTDNSRIEFVFDNNDRNIQLMLPLAINIVCTGKPCTPPPTPPPTPVPTRSMGNVTVLFEDGNKDDQNRSWACVRGPALVRTPNGSLLAFAGGGTSCADAHVGYRVLARASHDNGSSWSAIRGVVGDLHGVGGYIAPVVDAQRGVVLLLFNLKFGAETWITRSTDNGNTWSDAVNMTTDIGALAVGPPGGVQLASGRLVIAVHGDNGTSALFSDDGGDKWTRGTPVTFPADIQNGGESQLVDDRRGPLGLTMTIRVSSRNVLMNHAIAQSDDGGQSWGMARLVTQATGPTCEGSISRLIDGRLLLSAPHYPRWRYPADRKNLTVWLFGPESGINTTNGTSGKLEVQAQQQVWSGPAAYSALSPDGQFVLFEGGTTYRYASIMFARLDFS